MIASCAFCSCYSIRWRFGNGSVIIVYRVVRPITIDTDRPVSEAANARNPSRNIQITPAQNDRQLGVQQKKNRTLGCNGAEPTALCDSTVKCQAQFANQKWVTMCITGEFSVTLGLDQL